MNRGIRQGCPISALLYLFVAEILAYKLKHNSEIQGINILNMTDDIKTIQHADDVTLTLKNISSLHVAIKTVEEFCKHAGSKVNINKTQCILLGSLKDRYNNISGIDVTNDVVRCLGIYIGHNKNQCYELNWLHSFQNMEKLFESWKKKKINYIWKSMHC